MKKNILKKLSLMFLCSFVSKNLSAMPSGTNERPTDSTIEFVNRLPDSSIDSWIEYTRTEISYYQTSLRQFGRLYGPEDFSNRKSYEEAISSIQAKVEERKYLLQLLYKKKNGQ